MIEKMMVSITLGLAADHVDLLESTIEMLAERKDEISKDELAALVKSVKDTDKSFKQVLSSAQEQVARL